MQKKRSTVLVVAREHDDTRSLVAFLRKNEFDVAWVRDGEAGFNALDRAAADCLVAEWRAPRIDGMALLRRACQLRPEICAVLFGPGGEGGATVEASRLGACDLPAKPLQRDRLLAVLECGLARQRVTARLAEVEGRFDRHFGAEFLTGRSRPIRRVMDQVLHTAAAHTPVLIEGEAGTGKGVVAQALHQNGPRRRERLVRMDCAALEASALEGELFGIEHEGPSSAAAPHRGALEIADRGTLFLDRVERASPAVQVRLLRFLQDRAFERVGGTEKLRADVRVVAASEADLAAEVRAGRFREDLFERLSVVRVQMPALRDRREDVPLLVEAFIREFNREHGRRVTGVTRGALERLVGGEWPGNVGELRNTLEGMVMFVQGRRALDLSDLPDRLRRAGDEGERLDIAVGITVEGAERALIAATLRHTGNDKTRAAAVLGIGLRTLYRKIKRYSLR